MFENSEFQQQSLSWFIISIFIANVNPTIPYKIYEIAEKLMKNSRVQNNSKF